MSAARDRIAAGALEVFCRYGYAATTVRQVADHLGIQGPSLYSHVSSKAALLELVLAPLLDAIDDHLVHLPKDDDPQSLRDWLVEYRRLLEEHEDGCRLVVCDLGVNRHSPLAKRIHRQHVETRAVLSRYALTDEAHAASAAGAIVWPVLWLPAAVRGSAEEAVDRALDMLAAGRRDTSG